MRKWADLKNIRLFLNNNANEKRFLYDQNMIVLNKTGGIHYVK
jgi:hypothetical protein